MELGGWVFSRRNSTATNKRRVAKGAAARRLALLLTRRGHVNDREGTMVKFLKVRVLQRTLVDPRLSRVARQAAAPALRRRRRAVAASWWPPSPPGRRSDAGRPAAATVDAPVAARRRKAVADASAPLRASSPAGTTPRRRATHRDAQGGGARAGAARARRPRAFALGASATDRALGRRATRYFSARARALACAPALGRLQQTLRRGGRRRRRAVFRALFRHAPSGSAAAAAQRGRQAVLDAAGRGADRPRAGSLPRALLLAARGVFGPRSAACSSARVKVPVRVPREDATRGKKVIVKDFDEGYHGITIVFIFGHGRAVDGGRGVPPQGDEEALKKKRTRTLLGASTFIKTVISTA